MPGELESKVRALISECTIYTLTDDQLVNVLMERSISILALVDYFLEQYISANFLGGVADEPLESSPELDNCAIDALVCEGEQPFKQAKHLGNLWLSKRLSNRMSNESRASSFLYLIRSLQCIYLHQYLLGSDRSAQLNFECQSVLEQGALGKRTRFQQTDVANLFIKIEREKKLDMNENIESFSLPKAVSLTDDVLLNTVAFTGDISKEAPVLSLEEQSLVLLFCEINGLVYPKDETTNEQRLAYINTILRQAYPTSANVDEKNPVCAWPIATEALYKRSLIENTSVRKTERSLGQLELEQARFLKQLGCHKSALDIFLRWNRWFDIIDCYTQLNKRGKAEEVIRAQLDSGDQSPELYCALGDVTNDRAHYWTAWSVSNQKSARAMRSLAVVFMYMDKDYDKAIDSFEKSLAINGLQIGLWFTFGCCCLQALNYTKAENAFRRCVQLDPENFEAWNNCASAAMLRGKKDVALTLLKEACKHNYENWRIWDNISIISAEVGAFTDTIRACHRVLDLQNKFTDHKLLAVLTKAVLDDQLTDANDLPTVRHRAKLLELFGRVTASTTTNAETWDCYANLLLGEKPLQSTTFQRAVQYFQTAHRCRMQPGPDNWERCADKRDDVVAGLRRWAETVLAADKLVPLAGGDSEANVTGQEAFVQSSLAAMRLSLNAVKGRLKIIEESTINIEALDSIRKLVEDVDSLLSTVGSHLNA